MALPFFYEPAVSGVQTHFQLSEESSKHCTQVLRMRNGEQLQITNGKGSLYTARILAEDKRKTIVLIEEEQLRPRTGKQVSIGISLLKNASRLEWFLEKATEIGVYEIIPLRCTRTEHSRFRTDRMTQILVSAMLQSQQVWLPILHEPTKLPAVVQHAAHTHKLIAHCEEDRKTELASLHFMNDIQILIGPEGDFTPQEINQALEYHYQPVSLGNTRLRTETAGLVAAALLVNGDH